MHRTLLTACLALGSCLVGGACRSGANSGSGAHAFRSDWSPGIERPWIGPDYFAGRLQDWRLRDGRVECRVHGVDEPVRTLHLLTATLTERRAHATITVRTGPLEPATHDTADLAGFLIGAGGAGIDHRITAQVHGRPGPDGGLVCAVDGTGRVGFFDFEHALAGGERGGPLALPLQIDYLASSGSIQRTSSTSESHSLIKTK
jgi:alkaline phosphatase D